MKIKLILLQILYFSLLETWAVIDIKYDSYVCLLPISLDDVCSETGTDYETTTSNHK